VPAGETSSTGRRCRTKGKPGRRICGKPGGWRGGATRRTIAGDAGGAKSRGNPAHRIKGGAGYSAPGETLGQDCRGEAESGAGEARSKTRLRGQRCRNPGRPGDRRLATPKGRTKGKPVARLDGGRKAIGTGATRGRRREALQQMRGHTATWEIAKGSAEGCLFGETRRQQRRQSRKTQRAGQPGDCVARRCSKCEDTRQRGKSQMAMPKGCRFGATRRQQGRHSRGIQYAG